MLSRFIVLTNLDSGIIINNLGNSTVMTYSYHPLCFVQNYGQVSKYFSSLESLAFTSDVDSRILEVFQQFQALL